MIFKSREDYKKIIFFLILFALCFKKNIFAEAESFKIIDGLSEKKLSEYSEEINAFPINFTESDGLFKKIDFYDGQNRKLNLKNFRGKVVILHFWATWCGHCVNEMVELDRFVQKLEDEEIDDRIKIIAISTDETISKAKNFYKQRNLKKLDLFFDQNSSAFNSLNSHNKRSLPKTYIIDQNGKKVFQIDGAIEWNQNTNMLRRLKNLIK